MHLKFLFLFSFTFFIILDYLIKNNYLGNSIKNFYLKFIELNYFNIVLILSIIVFFILMLFSYFGFSLIYFDNTLFDANLVKFMSDSAGNNNVNVNTDATVNVNHPRFNISIPGPVLSNTAAAISFAGGMGAAIKAAQHMPGGPGVKALAGVGTLLTTQAITVGVAKILNSSNSSNNNNNNNNNTNNLINWFDGLSNNNNSNIINNLNDKFNDFPLNLLPEINQLATAELMFLLIILNIFIAKYITSLDYNKYLPNNKLGDILKKIINRYVILWSKSVNILLIISWSGLFICVISSKIFLYYVLNN